MLDYVFTVMVQIIMSFPRRRASSLFVFLDPRLREDDKEQKLSAARVENER